MQVITERWEQSKKLIVFNVWFVYYIVKGKIPTRYGVEKFNLRNIQKQTERGFNLIRITSAQANIIDIVKVDMLLRWFRKLPKCFELVFEVDKELKRAKKR